MYKDFGWRCPHCHNKLDGHLNCDQGREVPPNVGDITICLYCFNVFQVSVDNKLVDAPKAALKDPAVQAAIAATRKFNLPMRKAKAN
jgi:hypothetical protein